MSNKKTSALALLKVLEEHSDEDHIISQPDLLNLIDTIYDVKLDRRTLYSNINILRSFGYDISTYSNNGKGYYLRGRRFKESEIFLLCNAVHSSNYIPINSSKELINKLLSTQSKHFKSSFRNTVYVENNSKTNNKEFFINVELLLKAIKQKKVISFDYMHYNTKKELEKRRDELYRLSPTYLIYINEKTYLIGKADGYNDFVHYRVDKMKNIHFTDEKYIKVDKDQDPYEYAKSKIYMFHGDNERITIKCDYRILDDIIDIFGNNLNIHKEDDHFKAIVKSSRQGIIYLALQFINYMEVLDPLDLREEIKNTLKEGQKKYK